MDFAVKPELVCGSLRECIDVWTVWCDEISKADIGGNVCGGVVHSHLRAGFCPFLYVEVNVAFLSGGEEKVDNVVRVSSGEGLLRIPGDQAVEALDFRIVARDHGDHVQRRVRNLVEIVNTLLVQAEVLNGRLQDGPRSLTGQMITFQIHAHIG